MSEKEQLFKDFSPISSKEWKDKVVTDLKGADFDKKLLWKTENGMKIQPFYTEEDVTEDLDFIAKLKDTFPKPSNTADAVREWTNYMKVSGNSEKECNKGAMDAVAERGASGIIFDLTAFDSVNFETLLNGVILEAVAVSFENVKNPLALTESYFAYLKGQGANLSEISGYVQVAKASFDAADLDELAKVVQLTAEADNFYGLTIDTRAFINAGANHVQDMAFSMNLFVDYIDQLTERSVSAEQVVYNTAFKLGIGGDYFHEMAKFRAMRVFITEVASKYVDNYDPTKMYVMASSSKWSKSLYDAYVNMLRNSTEAMAAVLGGVEAIYVEPYDSTFKETDTFSNRISLNVSHLLREESYFNKVVDPAAGSYFIDNLTKMLLEAAFEVFKANENAGGFIKLLEKGDLKNQIAEVREGKRKLISQRRNVYVGTNRYPNQEESVDSYSPEHLADVLPSERAPKVFEDMRLRTDAFVKAGGKRPKVFHALFGNLAMRKARATFSADFFGTAGFQSEEQFFDDHESAVKGALASDANIIVICSSDQEYALYAAEFARAFKTADENGRHLILAGYPADVVDSLKEAGVDDFVHVKSNAIDMLTDLQNKLGVKA